MNKEDDITFIEKILQMNSDIEDLKKQLIDLEKFIDFKKFQSAFVKEVADKVISELVDLIKEGKLTSTSIKNKDVGLA